MGGKKGEAPLDLWVVDIRRFSDLHKDRGWVSRPHARGLWQALHHRFPHEEYASGRPRIARRSMTG
jgi:sarcosine dehydrogenase